MSIESDIDDILYSPKLKFFMYLGGAGGEFIVHKLSHYSPMFTPLNVDKVDFELNRYFLSYPKLVRYITFNQMNNNIKEMLLKKYEEGNISLNLIHAVKSIIDNLSDQMIYLIRVHWYSNSIFNNETTWRLVLDTKENYDYRFYLKLIKIYFCFSSLEELDDELIIANISDTSVEKSRLDELKKYMVDRNINKIFYGKLHLCCNLYSGENSLTVEQIFNMSDNELMQELVRLTLIAHKNQSNDLPGKKVMFSELFKKKGQFQEEFKMNTDDFYNETVGWHLRNIELLKKYGINTEQYNFHLN